MYENIYCYGPNVENFYCVAERCFLQFCSKNCLTYKLVFEWKCIQIEDEKLQLYKEKTSRIGNYRSYSTVIRLTIFFHLWIVPNSAWQMPLTTLHYETFESLATPLLFSLFFLIWRPYEHSTFLPPFVYCRPLLDFLDIHIDALEIIIMPVVLDSICYLRDRINLFTYEYVADHRSESIDFKNWNVTCECGRPSCVHFKIVKDCCSKIKWNLSRNAS